MKNKKNVTAALVALALMIALVAGVFSGCGAGENTPTEPHVTVDPGNNNPTTEPVAEPTTEPSEEPTTEPVEEPTTEPSTEPVEDPTTEPITQPTEHIHSYQAGNTVKPTCGKEGYTVYTCSCGATYDGDITSATGHAWTAWTTTREATVEKEGEKVRNCTNCGMKETKLIDKLPEPPATEPTEPPTQPTEHSHSYRVTETVEATCTKGGYKVYTCSCGDSYTSDKTDALNHNYKAEVVAPTTEAEGYTLHTCSRCGDSYKDNYTEKLPEPSSEPTGHHHNFVVQKVQEPTCLDMGFTFLLCDCGEEAFEDIKDALGHDFSSGATCSRCGYSEESTVKLDYAAAIAYGNQYAANTYGWTIDLSLNEGNAGFNFPSSESVDNVISKGGQAYLNKRVTQKVDALYSTLSSRGDDWIYASVNCDVYEYGDGGILIYVYYG